MRNTTNTTEKKYTIGIVTYHARFEIFFKPLINKLMKIFPDTEILCIANGHPDRNLQIIYLDKFTTFVNQFKNIRYLTYDQHQSLAKCWNQLIILSNTEGFLMLNDDIMPTELFRQEFEKKILGKEFTTINGSWSHFHITKKFMEKIGWFDENLLGIGQEDGDYMCRMSIKGYNTIEDTECLGIKNYVAPSTNPGFKNMSGITDGKYSTINKDYIKTKYSEVNNTDSQKKYFSYVWKKHKAVFYQKENHFKDYSHYNIDTLHKKNEKSTKNSILIKSISFKIKLQKIYYLIIKLLKNIKHYKINKKYEK